jgi:hypothetical protein
MTRDGRRLMRYGAVENASSQNFNGMPASASKERPISTMCRCLRSAEPLCWCVCVDMTHDVQCPYIGRKV